MILFSSNHHHSHIPSQSILYHYIYSININSQFQTLFFRQTINSYIKFTSISLFYFTLPFKSSLFHSYVIIFTSIINTLINLQSTIFSNYCQISISFFISFSSLFESCNSFLIRDYCDDTINGLDSNNNG